MPETRRGTRFIWPWVIVLAVVAICALALLWFPLQRIGSLPAINYNEGWNAYRDRMAADGVPLYAARPHLWITNYPFLSFHIVGLLGLAIGNMLVAGRVIALASLVAIGIILAGIVRTVTGVWRSGALAGLVFLLWVETFTPYRVAMDDPDLLAAAITLVGTYAYVCGPSRARWLVISAIAFAAGLFTKQDVIALPLGVGMNLVATRNWRGFAVWVGAGTAAGGALLLATYRLDGPYLAAHLLRARPYSIVQAGQASLQFLQRFWAPLALGGSLPFWSGKAGFRDLFAFTLLLATLIAMVFAGGDGVARNIFYVPLIITAATAAMAVDRLERRLPSSRNGLGLIAAILVLAALPGVAFAPGRFSADLAANAQLPAMREAAQRTVALLRGLPGPAICQNILICYEAGKPLSFDTFFVRDQVETGRLNEAAVMALLTAHHYGAVQVYSASVTAHATGRSKFFVAFMTTLRTTYRPLTTGPVNAVFVPKSVGRGR